MYRHFYIVAKEGAEQMGLFSASVRAQIDQVAAKSTEKLQQSTKVNSRSMNDDLNNMSKQVIEYFKDSPAILITSKDRLHEYVNKCIEFGYAGIDTETTGLDRLNDWIVGASLYVPGEPECYIPMKHLVPIFETPYKNQLTYDEVAEEFQRLVDGKVKLIFANADFDLAMIYHSLKVDLIPSFYYDVISAWRALKENEPDNALKVLYAKYVLKGKADPKKFSDFFSPALFPYCKPEVAKLYAANDAKITYELFLWQLPFVTPDNEKCKKNKLEKIANLIWNIEFPMVKVCAMLHRRGVYLDNSISPVLHDRYTAFLVKDKNELANMIQLLIDDRDIASSRTRPFSTGRDFNPNSQPHLKYLFNKLLGKNLTSFGKDELEGMQEPVAKQILKVRGDGKLIGTYVDKMPKAVGQDTRVHACFRSMGAATGRMCIAKGTKITVLNGTKNIEDIIPGDLVYCYDSNGLLQLSPVKNLWLTGKDRECVDIKWQSSGSGDIGHLICTPEHNILMKDGSWKPACDLKRHEKMAHLRRTQGPKREPRPQLYGWNGLATREQDVVKYSIFKCSSDLVIHHKDGDCSNNDLSNLEILTNSEHCRLHGKKAAEQGTLKYDHLWSKDSIAKGAKTRRSAYLKQVMSEKDELIQAIHNAKGVLSNVPYDFDSFKQRCKIAGVDYVEECKKAGNLAYKYRRAKDLSEEEFLECFNNLGGNYIAVSEYLNISQYTFYEKCKEYNIALNHAVQSVTPAGRFDVYDIEVDTYHNFIANEICVHNSSDSPNLQNIPSHALDIRHLFRATPEQTEVISIDSVDDNIHVVLSYYDKVPTTDGQKEVKDLNEGDVVLFKEGSTEVKASVTSIKRKLGEATIDFRKEVQ